MSHLNEIMQALEELELGMRPEKFKGVHYVGAGKSRLTFLDVKTPEQRLRFKRGFSFSNEDARSQWKIWDEIWRKASVFEAMNFSLYWADSRRDKDLLDHLPQLIKWQRRVDNWAHSDSLSSLFAYALEHESKLMWEQLEDWSGSKQSWDCRQSIVGIYCYASSRGKLPPFKRAMKLIQKQLRHPDYFVQKGVGWALRESYNAYPRETLLLLEKEAAQLTPVAWQAASEKLPSVVRAKFLRQRMEKRRSAI